MATTALRLAEVLPLHAVRLGPDAARLLALFFLAKDPVTGEFLRTFDMRELTDTAGAGIARSSQLLIFGGMFIGFGVKVPMFPFHLAARCSHAGAYAGVGDPGRRAAQARHVRLHPHLDPDASRSRRGLGTVIGLLAVIGIIYGALGCLAQTDMKRLMRSRRWRTWGS